MGCSGIVGELVDIQVECGLAFGGFGAARFEQGFQFAGVDVEGIGERSKVVGQQVGLGHAQDQCAVGLRHGAAIGEGGVTKVRVPVEVVVDGVVDAAGVFSAIAHVERGDAEVIEEGGEVRAGAERADAQIAAAGGFFAVLGFAEEQVGGLPALPDGWPVFQDRRMDCATWLTSGSSE